MDTAHRLHWSQRIALARHNLHAARRTNDYAFFKTLQAHALIDGTDHVAVLYAVLGDDADQVLSTLDNLNAGIAYVHQDAFKAVYDGAKSTMYKADNSLSSRKSLLRVDIGQQRDMADHAIDKTANSAINLIQAQPTHCQDAIANAWITGTTIIADAVCVCLNQMDTIEDNLDDFIRLEYSWNCIQSSVDAAISALRGIFSLMASSSGSSGSPSMSRNLSISSAVGSESAPTPRSRTSSTASAFGLIKRAFSHSQMNPPPTPKSRAGSLPLPEANARGFRLSMSAACPTRMSNYGDHRPTFLNTIPATPGATDTPVHKPMSPFEDKRDYFAFDMEREVDKTNQESFSDDPMQLESLDPLYTPAVDEIVVMPVPLAL